MQKQLAINSTVSALESKILVVDNESADLWDAPECQSRCRITGFTGLMALKESLFNEMTVIKS